MTEMHAEVRKSKTLQHIMQSTTLAHISNRRKDTKDKYFAMLGHDIAMYIQHQKEVERDAGSITQLMAPPLIRQRMSQSGRRFRHRRYAAGNASPAECIY